MHDSGPTPNGTEATPQTGRGNICIVMNSGSGKKDTSQIPDRIAAAFGRADVSYRLDIVKSGADITDTAQRAVEEGFSTIVAAGGDGTICAVASVVRNSGRKMGIIPLGTFNYFARSLDIPVEVEDAVDVIVAGSERHVPIATINNRVFLNNSSLGAYPEILKNREEIYARWGRSRVAAYWSVFKTLVMLRRPLKLQIVTQGETRDVTTPLVFAVNNAFQLEQIGLAGREEVAQGKLVLFIAPNSGRLGMLRHALALIAGNATQDRNFDIMAADHIRIETRRGARMVACDGERTRMKSPFELQVHPRELCVTVPNARREGVR